MQIEAFKSTQDRMAWHRELHANQQVMYRSKGLIQDVSAVDASSAVKWREGVLEIADKPLPQVLDELRRYTDERIVIRDWRLKEIKVGGIMSIRDVPATRA